MHQLDLIFGYAGWLGSYGGEDSPNDITRGMFAGEVGTPRMLKLFKKYNMKVSSTTSSTPLDFSPLILLFFWDLDDLVHSGTFPRDIS